MGTSTDAILFYGYVWDDEATERQLDILESAQNMDLEGRKEGRKPPCLIGTHCSGECPMLFVAAVASHTKAWRGHPREISSLFVDPRWNAQLSAFCRDLGISLVGKKATWWLVSDWT